MKKLLIISTLLLSGCSAGFEINRHNEHSTGTPKYGANDTVQNWRNRGRVYVIDSAVYQPGKRQVFYTAHNSDGTVQWLPENSIKKY